MRIMHISGRADLTGGCIVLKRLIDWQQASHEIAIACPDDGELSAELEQSSRLGLHPVPTRKISWNGIRNILQAIDEHRIKVLHSHGKCAGLYARIVKLFRPQVLLVHHYHGFNIPGNKIARFCYKLYEAGSLRITSAVVFVSGDEQLAFQEFLGNALKPTQGHVVVNGIKQPDPKVLDDYESREAIVLFIGRLGHQKNPHLAIDLAAQLKTSGVPFRLRMVGGEDDYSIEEMRRYSAGKGVLDHCDFAGVISDMAAEYRKARVLISTSRWEGLPTVVVEAMAYGLPVVATRVVGSIDLVSQAPQGELHDAADIKNLAKSIISYLGENQGSLSNMDYISRSYSVDSMGKSMDEIYTLKRPA